MFHDKITTLEFRDVFDGSEQICGRQAMLRSKYRFWNLTNGDLARLLFLTFALFSLHIPHVSFADTALSSNTANGDDRKRILGDVQTYIRKQALHGVSILPADLRSTLGWFSGTWHDVALPGDETEDRAALDAPLAPRPENDAPVSLASNFHHKGFLPTHDAMVLGAGWRHAIIDERVQLDARPFYGQNWRALQGYWGGEMTLNVAAREDGLPWGKIALGYTGGNQALTDHGTGVNLRGSMNLTSTLTLDADMRQQDSAVSSGNALMLRWRVPTN